jgi:hypothetical protein
MLVFFSAFCLVWPAKVNKKGGAQTSGLFPHRANCGLTSDLCARLGRLLQIWFLARSFIPRL